MARCRTDLRRDRSGARGAGRADLAPSDRAVPCARGGLVELGWRPRRSASFTPPLPVRVHDIVLSLRLGMNDGQHARPAFGQPRPGGRSEERTSELQSLMRISYAVFCLKKKKEIIPSTHQY